MRHIESQLGEPIILLIDGQCNLCHGITRFVIKRDPRAQFRFASLQSEVGQQLLLKGGLLRNDLDTFVMIDNDRYYTKSTAALRTCRKLGRLWTLLFVARVVPLFIRDRVYDFIASRRYRWFGHQESCLIPTESIRSRFLDYGWESDKDEV
ncbi:thiol-disulfide oxidoreductase DCC family protein [Cohnella sp. WQ 127256]|uniref:thiol-disulfide oxidoreductase DCC family protein n=1 Tax=Cohnella sp. WQ 127256 TaxID=2938790 RepID=UPI002117FECA|nr:DCC1-like thiol-disulfide oxidoreductase family protein [Cohnella sp. WQ 127256]